MKRTAALCMTLLALVSCKRESSNTRGDAPPPVAPVVAGICSSGGGKIVDPTASKLLPTSFGGYCIDPNNEVRTYGKEAKGTIEQVCTELFDGECEVYRGYGLERVVSARYADGSGTPGNVTVNLSRFESVPSAFGFFTRRIVGDSDPLALTLDVIDAGTQAALGSGIAYVWRGVHVAELSYSNDNEAPEALKASAKQILPVLGKSIGELLPGDRDLPTAARLLPEAGRIKLGMVYEPKDVLGVVGAGPGAIGYYRDGERRYRVMTLERPNEQAAQDVMKTFRRVEGGSEQKGPPTTITLVMRAGSGGAKSEGTKIEWVIGRVGKAVVAVGDEEHSKAGSSTGPQLTTAEKTSRLVGLLNQHAKAQTGSADP